MQPRTLSELLTTDEPAWPMVREWIAEATNPVEVLAPSDPGRGEALHFLQVTARSPMGAIVYETGGLLIDHGWLRLLGSGHPRLPRSLPQWNVGRTWRNVNESPPFLLVADDVLGGFFAVNGGALGPDRGMVYYFAPDNLRWELTELQYTPFLQWCLSGNLAGFYENSRWDGWEEEARRVYGDQGISILPPLWAKGPAIGARSRRTVPIAELYGLHVEEFGKVL